MPPVSQISRVNLIQKSEVLNQKPSTKQPLVEVAEQPEENELKEEVSHTELLDDQLPPVLHRQNMLMVEEGWDISNSSDEEKPVVKQLDSI